MAVPILEHPLSAKIFLCYCNVGMIWSECFTGNSQSASRNDQVIILLLKPSPAAADERVSSPLRASFSERGYNHAILHKTTSKTVTHLFSKTSDGNLSLNTRTISLNLRGMCNLIPTRLALLCDARKCIIYCTNVWQTKFSGWVEAIIIHYFFVTCSSSNAQAPTLFCLIHSI